MSRKEMLINYVPGEECRIAIVEDGRLEELYHERADNESHVGNIYKGRVTNVEPGIQAAFVDFGLPRNGFLHVSDLHPMYFPAGQREQTELVGKKTPRRDRPPIQQCLRRGQEILVQVLKEGIGTKGPTLTSYLSIPGRFLVMMPHMERLGVSRKVEDDEARKEMRKVLDELNPPEGFGFIIRTAGIGRTKLEIKRDLAYLQRLWKAIDRRMTGKGIGDLYTESDLVIRTIRDVFSNDIERVIIDDPEAARRARDFLLIANPRSGSRVVLYKDPIPLFHRYDLERQIEGIHARTVPLKSGGSLVIDPTEALVAIDVNSGKMRDNSDAESTAFRTNQEAADEVCRQLRLRDLGGVVAVDFIDMRLMSHRREIEHRIRNNLKNDRARTRVAAISPFGVLELTRQRMRPSIKKSVYIDCPACVAQGEVKSPDAVVLDVMRRLALVLHHKGVARVDLSVSPDVAFLLLNRKRGQLVALENQYSKSVMVRVHTSGPVDQISIACYDERGGILEAERTQRFAEPLLEPVEGGSDLTVEADLVELAEENETEAAAAEDSVAAVANESGEEGEIVRSARFEDVEDETLVPSGAEEDLQQDAEPAAEGSEGSDTAEAGEGDQPRRRRRRRRRGGRGRRGEGESADLGSPAEAGTEHEPEDRAPLAADLDAEDPVEHAAAATLEAEGEAPEDVEAAVHDTELAPELAEHDEGSDDEDAAGNLQDQPGQAGEEGGQRRRRRRRRGGRGRRRGRGGQQPEAPVEGNIAETEPDQPIGVDITPGVSLFDRPLTLEEEIDLSSGPGNEADPPQDSAESDDADRASGAGTGGAGGRRRRRRRGGRGRGNGGNGNGNGNGGGNGAGEGRASEAKGQQRMSSDAGVGQAGDAKPVSPKPSSASVASDAPAVKPAVVAAPGAVTPAPTFGSLKVKRRKIYTTKRSAGGGDE